MLGEEAGDLARDVREGSERRDTFAPSTIVRRALRRVVEDEAHARLAAHRLDRRRKLRDLHEQVVDETGLTDCGDAALHVVAEEPPRIGLVLYDVANADERPGERRKLRRHVAGEVEPADDAEEERGLGGEGEQLPRLGELLTRLHHHRADDAGRPQQRLEVVRPVSPPENRDVVGHPGVVGPGGIPEVLVGVDDRRGHASGSTTFGKIRMIVRWILC